MLFCGEGCSGIIRIHYLFNKGVALGSNKSYIILQLMSSAVSL